MGEVVRSCQLCRHLTILLAKIEKPLRVACRKGFFELDAIPDADDLIYDLAVNCLEYVRTGK